MPVYPPTGVAYRISQVSPPAVSGCARDGLQHGNRSRARLSPLEPPLSAGDRDRSRARLAAPRRAPFSRKRTLLDSSSRCHRRGSARTRGQGGGRPMGWRRRSHQQRGDHLSVGDRTPGPGGDARAARDQLRRSDGSGSLGLFSMCLGPKACKATRDSREIPERSTLDGSRPPPHVYPDPARAFFWPSLSTNARTVDDGPSPQASR